MTANAKTVIRVILIGCALLLLSGCASLSRFAADLAVNLGHVPTVRTNLQYVGVSDDVWAKQNNLSNAEMEVFKTRRKEWLDFIIDSKDAYSNYPRFSTWEVVKTNLIAVADEAHEEFFSYRPRDEYHATPIPYYVQFPEDAPSKIIAKSKKRSPRDPLLFLCDDGYYLVKSKISGKANAEIPTYYIYYTVFADETAQTTENLWFYPLHMYKDEMKREAKMRPWDLKEKIKEVARENKLKAEKDAENQRKLALLGNKMSLGPLQLGISRKDLPPGELVRGPEQFNVWVYGLTGRMLSGDLRFIPKEEIVYATEPIDVIHLTFEYDILTEIHFEFRTGRDNELLIDALHKKFGYATSSELSYFDGSRTYYWRVGYNTLRADMMPDSRKHLVKDHTPYIELSTSRFDDRIKAIGERLEAEKKAADDKKSTGMMNEL